MATRFGQAGVINNDCVNISDNINYATYKIYLLSEIFKSKIN